MVAATATPVAPAGLRRIVRRIPDGSRPLQAKEGRLEGVELFTAGLHGQGSPEEDVYTEQDLLDAARNFDALPIEVPIAIGHEEKQELLEKVTGRPAGGWAEKTWRQGDTLYADFGGIPEVVGQWINDGLYRFVSVEFYTRPPDDLPGSGLVLRRVALLGATPPKVKGLRELPFVQYFAEKFTMDRDTMLKLAAGCGLGQEFLDSLSDDQLGLLVADMAAKSQPAAGADAGAGVTTNADAGAGGDSGAGAGGDAGTGGSPSRDQMIQELIEMGQDPQALTAMDDASLAAMYQQLKGGQPNLPVGKMGEGSDCPPEKKMSEGAAAGADAGAAANQTLASVPQVNTTRGLPAMPALNPTQVVFKYGEVMLAKLKAAEASLDAKIKAADDQANRRVGEERKATINVFCERMVKAGKLTPAQVEPGKGSVRLRLERADSVKKFSEGAAKDKTELELQMAEIEAGPVVKRFGEQLQDPAGARQQTLSDERRRRMLGSNPLGQAILKEEALAAAKK